MAPFCSYEDGSYEDFNSIILQTDGEDVAWISFYIPCEELYEIPYGQSNIYEQYFVLASNITFTGFSNISVFYSYEFDMKLTEKYSQFAIYYIVNSGSRWFGNASEMVTFNVEGHQPYSSREYDYPGFSDCEIIEKDSYTSYIWQWINEDLRTVYYPQLIFSGSSNEWFLSTYGIYIILGSSIAFVIAVSVVLRIIYKRRM